MAKSHVAAIKRVCKTVDLPDDYHVGTPWPSHIYFEDVNGESEFELIEVITRAVRENGAFSKPDHN